MNQLLLLMLNTSSMKRIAIVVCATLVLIVSMPIGAVLAFTNIPLLGWVAPLADAATATGGTIYNDPITAGNNYDYGFCTYWAALRRIQTHDPIPNDWGDAITWNIRAMLAGYVVDQTPSPGAIFQWPDAPGGLGHVAYVESVDPTTGAWTISEMNAAGWDVVDNRTYPAAAAHHYNFIHDKAKGLGL